MINSDQIRAFVEANPKLVTRHQSARYPELYVLKYHRKVFYDNLWDKDGILNVCRGLVVDKDYNIVVRPLVKIFNRFENNTDIPRDEEVTAVRKINGFMACLTTSYKYGKIISTTGSLDSPYVEMARPYLEAFDGVKDMPVDTTYVFEICDVNDPHIIDEFHGAYLLAGIQVLDGFSFSQDVLDNIARTVDFRSEHSYCGYFFRPEWQKKRFVDVVAEAKTCRHEGFVVYGKNTTLKIKSPYYLMTKLFGRMRADKLIKCLDSDQFMRQSVEEEFYPVFEYLATIKDEFVKLDEQARIALVRAFIEEKY